MSKFTTLLLIALLIITNTSSAQFGIEDSDETGTTNPSDFSWRYYQDIMKRFPSRVSIICYSAYIMDKTNSDVEDILMFLHSCAEKGSVAAMIYLSSMYENGNRITINYERSAYWLKRGTETKDEAGFSELAAYHYGMAILEGQGVKKDTKLARQYLQRAADAGIEDAISHLQNN